MIHFLVAPHHAASGGCGHHASLVVICHRAKLRPVLGHLGEHQVVDVSTPQDVDPAQLFLSLLEPLHRQRLRRGKGHGPRKRWAPSTWVK